MPAAPTRRAVLLAALVLGGLSYARPLLWAQGPVPTLRRPPGAVASLQAPLAGQPGSPVVTVPGAVPAPPASTSIPTQPAVAVTEVTSPAAPAHYTDQAIWALMMSLLIQWLKKTAWFGWITPTSSSRLKAQFGFWVAFLTAAGIHFAVSGSVLEGGGASITITGLSLNAAKDVAWQWASQQAWYRGLVQEPTPPLPPPPDLSRVIPG